MNYHFFAAVLFTILLASNQIQQNELFDSNFYFFAPHFFSLYIHILLQACDNKADTVIKQTIYAISNSISLIS